MQVHGLTRQKPTITALQKIVREYGNFLMEQCKSGIDGYRRSQHRSYTWEGFKEMTRYYDVPKPRVVEQWWIKPPAKNSLNTT